MDPGDGIGVVILVLLGKAAFYVRDHRGNVAELFGSRHLYKDQGLTLMVRP
jgi:hypothetical protein